jgi:hypothetical protein
MTTIVPCPACGYAPATLQMLRTPGPAADGLQWCGGYDEETPVNGHAHSIRAHGDGRGQETWVVSRRRPNTP